MHSFYFCFLSHWTRFHTIVISTVQFTSLSHPVQMQLLLDVRTFRSIVPKSILLTETQRVLTQLVGGSANGDQLDCATEILDPQEQR